MHVCPYSSRRQRQIQLTRWWWETVWKSYSIHHIGPLIIIKMAGFQPTPDSGTGWKISAVLGSLLLFSCYDNQPLSMCLLPSPSRINQHEKKNPPMKNIIFHYAISVFSFLKMTTSFYLKNKIIIIFIVLYIAVTQLVCYSPLVLLEDGIAASNTDLMALYIIPNRGRMKTNKWWAP